VPVTLFAGQVLHVGGLPLQIAGRPGFFVTSSSSGPRGWGRVAVGHTDVSALTDDGGCGRAAAGEVCNALRVVAVRLDE
jgi:hypothetical protein